MSAIIERNILINGTSKLITSSTIAQLVDEFQLASDSLVIEHNHTIVRQENWQETPLSEGDTVEMLHFVGGG